jgi:anaerobic selenocysteine-containing dehydrogenase
VRSIATVHERLTYCRICAAACGVVVGVEVDAASGAETVVRVRGDAQHPVSRGYTCAKGRGIPAWHHDARRLDAPRVRGETRSWDDTLDDLAGIVRDVVGSSGPDAVALYLATGLAYDAGGQIAAATWLPALGSSSFYSAATVDNAPILVAAELVTGTWNLNPVWNPYEAGLLVLVGTNPVVSHGYGTTLPDPVRHYRDFRKSGGRIWVLDPRRTESAALADEHVAVRPGADVAVLAALTRALLVDGADTDELARYCDPAQVAALRDAVEPFTPERAEAEAAIPIAAFERLLAEVRAHRGRVAIFCGTGTTMATDGVLVEWLRWVLLVLTGSLDRPGGMRFNRGAVNRPQPPRVPAPAPAAGPRSRPDLPRVVGQMPAVALVDEIEAGNVRVLVLTGGNPITALPEPDRTRAALRRLDALVVIDVMDSELCELATHVLPATGQLERADLSLAEHVALRSGLQATRAIVEPAEGRRPVWWMLAALSHRLRDTAPGLASFLGGADPALLDDESFLRGVLASTPLDPEAVFAAGPRGIDVAIEHGWVHDTMLPNGRWQVAPPVLIERLREHRSPTAPLVLTPRREMAWSNSVRYAGNGKEAVLHLHPDDAATHGFGDGAPVRVSSRAGEITVTVVLDANVRRGVASVTHGRFTDGPGVLTSSTLGVDLLTTMPHASGVPVELRGA